MTNLRPLLSICIPTYNRADWLRVCLLSLAPMMPDAGALVEVVVSDNASPDDGATARLVADMQTHYSIRFHQQERNIGLNPNVLFTVGQMAQGEYVWVIGDDDVPCSDILARLLSMLQMQPQLDFVYINHLLYNGQQPLSETTSQDAISVYNSDFQDKCLPQLQDILPQETNCFTAIYSFALRRTLAMDAFRVDTTVPPFANIGSVVPHAAYIIQNLLHRPAGYLGQPGIIASSAISWKKYAAQYNLVLAHDLHDLLEANGVARDTVDILRRQRLRWSTLLLQEMLTDPNAGFHDTFSLWDYLKRHARFPELWAIVQEATMRSASTNPVLQKAA